MICVNVLRSHLFIDYARANHITHPKNQEICVQSEQTKQVAELSAQS